MGKPQSKLHEPLPVLVLQVFGVPFGPPSVLNTKSLGLSANKVSALSMSKFVVFVCPLTTLLWLMPESAVVDDGQKKDVFTVQVGRLSGKNRPFDPLSIKLLIRV